MNRHSAVYCPTCGQHWQTCADTYTGDQSWSQTPWSGNGDAWRSKSPRRMSPRRRSGNRNGGKGAGKGEAKGPLPAQAPAPARVPNRVPKVEAPAASALPAAPNVPAISLPKGSAGSSAGTAEHSIIQAFMEQCAKQENLSDELRELMARVGGSNVQQETKELHRLVKNRSEACAALNQIQSDRISFEAAWASYTQSLVTLLQEQLAKRQSTLEELDKAQSEWTNKLREVTVQIKQTTGTVEQGADLEEIRSSSSEEMECVVAEEAEREAKRLTRQREMTEQHNQLLQALQQVHSAASANAERRDGSRTPRRSKDAAGVKLEVKKEPGEAGKDQPPFG